MDEKSTSRHLGRDLARGGAAVETGSLGGVEGAIFGAGLGILAGGPKEFGRLAVSHISSAGADRRLFQEDERVQTEAAVPAPEEQRASRPSGGDARGR